jgi:hypothetical protein
MICNRCRINEGSERNAYRYCVNCYADLMQDRKRYDGLLKDPLLPWYRRAWAWLRGER